MTTSRISDSPLGGEANDESFDPTISSDGQLVAFESFASNLVAGTYSSNLVFTNLADSFGQNRLITLAIVTPPVITVQPADQAVLQGMAATFSVGGMPIGPMFFSIQSSAWSYSPSPM